MTGRVRLAVKGWLDGRPVPLGGYMSAEFNDAHNGDGNATLTYPARTRLLGTLTQEKLVVTCHNADTGAFWWGGRVTSKKVQTAADGTVVAPFHSDLTALKDWVAFPNPARPVNDQQVEFWQQTGPAETVVKNVLSANLSRVGEAATVAPSKGRGSSQTVKARLEPLWEHTVDVAAAGGIGLRASRDQTTGALTYDCYDPADDVYPVPLRPGDGIVHTFDWEAPHPEATVVIVAGYGDGAQRVFLEVSSAGAVARWGRIEKVVEFPSATAGTTADDMYLFGLQQLTQMLPKNARDITLADTADFKYAEPNGVRLGTTVTLDVLGERFTDVIGAVKITDTPAEGVRVVLTVGDTTARTDADSILARHLARIEARLATRNL